MATFDQSGQTVHGTQMFAGRDINVTSNHRKPPSDELAILVPGPNSPVGAIGPISFAAHTPEARTKALATLAKIRAAVNEIETALRAMD